MESIVGQLYIVATPIGNRKDMTTRAIEILQSVDEIYAEDTRHSKPLLQYLNVAVPTQSLHQHNEVQRINLLLDQLQQGKNIALISDAGTPLISDPGYKLVSTIIEQGYLVTPIPGACAVIAALSAAGLPTDRFLFEGFLPAKTKARKDRLEKVKTQTCTLVFYESKHRIFDMLDDLTAVMGERQLVVARELTKAYESWYRGTIAEVREMLMSDEQNKKGEFVLLLAGAKALKTDNAEADRLLKILLKELPTKKAAKAVADITGLKKNDLYQRALAINE